MPDDPHHRLREEIAKLRASRERIVRAADADRRALERELHRGVQQHLVALAINLQLAGLQVDSDPTGAKAALEDMRRDVQQALGEATALAEHLSPPLLEAGLAVALRAAVARVGYPVAVAVDLAGGCSPEVARTILLCCQLALERPSAGPPASATVRTDGGDVVAEVAVTGGGIDGHDALSDRVEALGGRLEVVSVPDGAARLIATLPLVR